MNPLSYVDKIVIGLLIIGGLNWGLRGLFDFDLVVAIFRLVPLIKTVYTAVGLSAVYALGMIYKHYSRR